MPLTLSSKIIAGHMLVSFFIANVLIRCNRPYILLCAHLNMTCRLKISSRIICSNMYWNRIVQVHVLVGWPLSLYVQVVPWPREVLIVQIPISIWIDLFRFLLGIWLICLVPIRLWVTTKESLVLEIELAYIMPVHCNGSLSSPKHYLPHSSFHGDINFQTMPSRNFDGIFEKIYT